VSAARAPEESTPMTPDQNTAERKERLADRRAQKSVDTFRVSLKGFRRSFSKHFGDGNTSVEALAYHLAQVEASLPNVREAIRLARYPNAGNRNPKRFALGLMENLSALESHLRQASNELETLASGRSKTVAGAPESEEE
jgi:hypothetical protein